MAEFVLHQPFPPAGDQPKAIEQLLAGLASGAHHQTLVGVTGSGKTYTIANVIAATQRPTLVIAPNKTLAAQLTSEFRTFFPTNAVEYFVSYYDYYQPEAYVPGSDTYIEKEADINDEIDRLRHRATAAILSRRDTLIVASVSCIYGLGSPSEYLAQNFLLRRTKPINREMILRQLVAMAYVRTTALKRGSFRSHGPIIEIMPPDRESIIRLELGQQSIEQLFEYDPLGRVSEQPLEELVLYPAKHFVTSPKDQTRALTAIRTELDKQLRLFERAGKFLEAERLERRTRQDLEFLRELGSCQGIENYSRHLTGREPGEAPDTLIDFFPKDFLLVIDESHVTVPQIRGMYAGDRSRKQNLVDYGFRLPSAIDNRPLKFSEFEVKMPDTIYVSATPGPYELERSHQTTLLNSGIIEQIIRPTGLVDPLVTLRPAKNQIAEIVAEIEKTIAAGGRVLVTTLTKKQAENLTDYLKERSLKAGYLHSEVDTLDRVAVLDQLRQGTIDILVGVNLLREGLDLPEVTLVAILDADQEGFLRSETSLIQTMGRAARNVAGRVMLYADQITGSMARAIAEADRRRSIQIAYNQKHHITPQSIQKALGSIIDHELQTLPLAHEFRETMDLDALPRLIREKETAMKALASRLKFEEAALARDEIIELKRLLRTR